MIDRLCEKQFGAGAIFDGEMCACGKGFQVWFVTCRQTRASFLGTFANGWQST